MRFTAERCTLPPQRFSQIQEWCVYVTDNAGKVLIRRSLTEAEAHAEAERLNDQLST